MKSKNRGAFRRGYDPRRHQLTRAERQRGYKTLMAGGRRDLPAHVVAWVWRRIRSYYRQKR
jgi:hypothetical protein